MHLYIRKLLYKDLTKTNVEKILRQFRKLNWDDEDITSYAVKCLGASWNVRYLNIRCVANLLAGLTPYRVSVYCCHLSNIFLCLVYAGTLGFVK